MFLLTMLLLAVVSGGTLHRRAPCSCPSTDLGFYPSSSNSGFVGSTLRCVYPSLSRCQYNTADGSLLRDSNAGFCRTSAPGGTCPSTDLASYALGPGSGRQGSILYCTYPTSAERASTTYYCEYSDSGVLSSDHDAGLCPPIAVCTTSPSSIGRSSSSSSRPASIATLFPTSLEPSATALPASTANLRQLYNCKPCGHSQCTFSTTEMLQNAIWSFTVGYPVSNCNPNSNSPVTSSIGGSISIQDSWSIGASIGWDIRGLNVTAEGSWSRTEGFSYSQEITITINPGQMGVLVVNVLFQRTQGTMRVGSNQLFPLVSNQPFRVVDYSPETIPCDAQFKANLSTNSRCQTSWGSAIRSPTYVVHSIVILVVLFSVLLFI